jgi:thiaminase
MQRGYRSSQMAEAATRARMLTDDLWSSIGGVYAAILAHPFLAGLTDGEWSFWDMGYRKEA